MNETVETKTELQEAIWIEIIKYMENIYAQLANSQVEIERVNKELLQGKELEKAYKELQQLQAQLIHSEKMASLGQLAAGIAHEINNPLGGIVVYSHLLLEELPLDSPCRSKVEKIVKESIRCKEIVKGLLDFARQTESKIELTDLNKLLEETLALFEKQVLFQNIKIRKYLSNRIPKINVDKSQLQQAFTNIILNAASAMEGVGNLDISTKLTLLENSLTGLTDKKLVEIEFTDTGCGIPSENLKRIFDPFFTTKPAGQGTGLGLAITYGIVKKHNGSIDVKSEVGKGSIFTIKLPVE